MRTKIGISILLATVLLLVGCGQTSPQKEAASSAVTSAVVASTTTPRPSATPQPLAQAETKNSRIAESATPTVEPKVTATPIPAVTPVPTLTPTQAPAPSPTEKPAEQVAAQAAPTSVSMSYGELPLNLSTGSDQWWQIDSTDSAYWAVADNINAIRAAGGLSALSVDGGLSAAAGARCESFVAGGAFDHSGMTTKSEICAQGGITSASAVCTAWQGSADHYANIMRTDISSMGVACWWCTIDGNSFAYWVVTFG